MCEVEHGIDCAEIPTIAVLEFVVIFKIALNAEQLSFPRNN